MILIASSFLAPRQASTPSSDWSDKPTERGSETPLSFTSRFQLDKMDPRLLSEAATTSVELDTWDWSETINFNGPEMDTTLLVNYEDLPKDSIAAQDMSQSE